MKLLSIDAAGGLWGSERALLDVLDCLAEDVDVAVCCPPGAGLESSVRAMGIKVFPVYIANLHIKGTLYRLLAAVRLILVCLRFRPDVIHLNQAGAFGVAAIAARLLGIPMVAHVRIFEDVAYLANRKTDAKLLSGIIAISDAVELEIRQYSELSDTPLLRLYDAYKKTATGQAVKNQNQLVCIGRITPVKGQDVLVEAMSMAKLPPEARCMMVGSGDPDYAEPLRLEAGEQIEWVGYQDAVMPILAESEVLICCSHREPLGRVIFEAWDAGCLPVVYGGSGGAAEIVTASDGGLVYDRQTGEALASTLVTALEMPAEKRQELVGQGQAWMRNNTDPREYTKAFVHFLRQRVRR